MREISLTLTDLFGLHLSADINHYVTTNMQRLSFLGEQSLSLRQAETSHINRKLKEVVSRLGLSANELFNHVLWAPFASVRHEVEMTIEFRESFYQALLDPVAEVAFTAIHAGDTLEHEGKTAHVKIKKAKKASKVVVGGVINGTVKDTQKPFNIVINGDEWDECMDRIIHGKYNGSLVSDDQWKAAVHCGVLYRRLLDEFIGTLLNEEEPENYLRYREALDIDSELYNDASNVGLPVYSSYGRCLGKTFRRFSVTDKPKDGHLRLVSSQTKAQTSVPNAVEEEVFEWSQF